MLKKQLKMNEQKLQDKIEQDDLNFEIITEQYNVKCAELEDLFVKLENANKQIKEKSKLQNFLDKIQ